MLEQVCEGGKALEHRVADPLLELDADLGEHSGVGDVVEEAVQDLSLQQNLVQRYMYNHHLLLLNWEV